MTLPRAKPATLVMAVCALWAAGCGGTLEGKYRRGQLTTSTTGGTRAPASTPATPPGPATTTTTVPTSGNAVGQGTAGERKGALPGGTIAGSAVWRADVPPLGGRHR